MSRRELPLTAPEFEAEVRDALPRCSMSIHLIGSNYGFIPEGEDERSTACWQHELAAARSANDPTFSRIIWMPPGLAPRDARQIAFIEELRYDPHPSAELLQTSLEYLKQLVSDRLKRPSEDLKLRVSEKPKPPAKAAPAAPVAPRVDEALNSARKTHDVFICYSSKNLKLAGDVCAALEGAGVEYWIASEDILPGENYSGAIIEAINVSRVVIPIFTSNANVSRHVWNEIDRAFNKNKPVVLFRTENIDLSPNLEYYLSTGSWLEAWEPPIKKHLPELVKTVKLLLAKQSPVG